MLASLNHPHIAQIYGLEEGPAKAGPHVERPAKAGPYVQDVGYVRDVGYVQGLGYVRDVG